MVVNGAGTGGTARRSRATMSSGKTGTAQVISNAGQAAAAGQHDAGSARPRLVRVFRAARQPADCRRGLPRARRARLERRADRAAHAGHVLRQEGRPCRCRRKPAHRRRTSKPSRIAAGYAAMFERRLYYHIDWALLVAILALCALGVAMIYSTTSDPTRGQLAPVRHAALRHRARARSRWCSR